MSTPAQYAANKANAQRSTGPRTQAGKAAVSTNATTHGATSKTALLQGENQDAYETTSRNSAKDSNPPTATTASSSKSWPTTPGA